MKKLIASLMLLCSSLVFAGGFNNPPPGSNGRSTGTGAQVLQTSPTLITPNIGVATGMSTTHVLGVSTGTPTASTYNVRVIQ